MEIDLVIQYDLQPDKCAECYKPVQKKRKWFCSDICKWRHRFFTHPRLCNHRNFYQLVGFSAGRGQGKRYGGMIVGSMGYGGSMPQFNVTALSKNNLDLDKGTEKIRLGNGLLIKKEDAYELAEFVKRCDIEREEKTK